MKIESFTSLVCGSIPGTDAFSEILKHLKKTLTNVLFEVTRLTSEPDERVTLFGPLLGRSILELSFTCIVGRLDPFRILTLREFQMRANSTEATSLGNRSASAFQWSGDVRPLDKDPKKLWETDLPMSKISRSLLGDCYGDVFWKPAFVEVLDAITTSNSGPWISEIQGLDPDLLIIRTRADCDKIYSTLSKGIHQEFIIPPGSLYDKNTVIVYIKDAIRLASRIALLSHATPASQGKMQMTEAILNFTRAQSFESLT